MSVPHTVPSCVRQPPPRRPAGKFGSHGCLSVILALIGIILLLPGICSVIYMVWVMRPGVPIPAGSQRYGR